MARDCLINLAGTIRDFVSRNSNRIIIAKFVGQTAIVPRFVINQKKKSNFVSNYANLLIKNNSITEITEQRRVGILSNTDENNNESIHWVFTGSSLHRKEKHWNSLSAFESCSLNETIEKCIFIYQFGSRDHKFYIIVFLLREKSQCRNFGEGAAAQKEHQYNFRHFGLGYFAAE